jgi:hypothetical protein
LLVDEVLAVGDAAFQKKCLGKMGEVAGEGRTVLFVSHNLTAITELCSAAMHLSSGVVQAIGPAGQVCGEYLRKEGTQPVSSCDGISVRVEVLDHQGRAAHEWRQGETIRIRVLVDSERPLERPSVDVAFWTPNHVKVFAVEGRKLAQPKAPDALRSFGVEFQITNTGLTAPELHVDVGVKAEPSHTYVMLLRKAWSLLVALPSTGVYARRDTIVCLPTEARVVSLGDSCA